MRARLRSRLSAFLVLLGGGLAASCGGGGANHGGTMATAAGGDRPLIVLSAAAQATAAPLVLAADARHLLWTEAAGIVVADANGGGPRTLVADVFVTWMEVVGDRLLYRASASATDDNDDDVLWRVPLAGGAPTRVEARDPAWVPAPTEPDGVRIGDARGEVAVATDGVALELFAQGQLPQLIYPRASGHRWLTRPPVLVGDTVIAADLDPEGNLGIWRLSRTPAAAPTVLATADGDVKELATGAGRLYVLESVADQSFDAEPRDLLVAIDRSGDRSSLTSAASFEAIAARGPSIAYGLAPEGDVKVASLWLLDAGQPPRQLVERVGSELVGLTLTDTTVYWIEDGAIWSMRRSGGRPTRFHAPAWGDAGGNGRVQLVVDGASVYFSSVGLGATGVHRTRGGADSTELWAAPEDGLGDELIEVGGALFAIAGQRVLWRVPMNGARPAPIYTAPDDATLVGLTGGGGRLQAAVHAGDITDLVSIDPTTGAATPFLHLGTDTPRMVADDHALFLVDERTAWIVRAPLPPR